MANSDQKARDTLAADETDELISSEKVEGTAVYDRKGEKIGSVHHLMINKYTGQVAYAVISFGGFLGIAPSITRSRGGCSITTNRSAAMSSISTGSNSRRPHASPERDRIGRIAITPRASMNIG